MFSFNLPKFLQDPQIIEIVLSFRLLHMKPNIWLGCASASRDKWWALGGGDGFTLYQPHILTTEDTRAGRKILMAINLFFMDRLRKYFLKTMQ